MKFLKHIVLLVGLYLFVGKLGAQELRSEVFSLLNLDYPGLEQVKALHASGKDSEAASALLEYYKQRKGNEAFLHITGAAASSVYSSLPLQIRNHLIMHSKYDKFKS